MKIVMILIQYFLNNGLLVLLLLEDLPVLLSDAVQEYIKLSTRRETIEQLLGKIQNTDGKFNRSFFKDMNEFSGNRNQLQKSREFEIGKK
jgi:hypothetical protein